MAGGRVQETFLKLVRLCVRVVLQRYGPSAYVSDVIKFRIRASIGKIMAIFLTTYHQGFYEQAKVKEGGGEGGEKGKRGFMEGKVGKSTNNRGIGEGSKEGRKEGKEKGRKEGREGLKVGRSTSNGREIRL